ncbi:MAG: HAD family hydrolase [Nanoarchaeota archaeon]|jgi:phosphoglycolate phosphatase-like HAD superfamily hydrolase|nr:HAD family hydrolase [Nanoarchaeota archaeon]
MIKNIIFDWAGIIINDNLRNYTAVMGVFKQINIPTITQEEFKKEFILPIEDFYKKFQSNPNMELIHKTFLEETKKAKESPIYPKVKEILERIKNKNIKTFVLSGVPTEILNQQAKNNNLTQYFTRIIGNQFNKTQAIKDLLKQNNLNPNKTAYVGSQTNSMRLAKDNNLISIAVLGGQKSKEDLEKENPDYILESIDKIIYLL